MTSGSLEERGAISRPSVFCFVVLFFKNEDVVYQLYVWYNSKAKLNFSYLELQTRCGNPSTQEAEAGGLLQVGG